jgi:hypothetical protein
MKFSNHLCDKEILHIVTNRSTYGKYGHLFFHRTFFGFRQHDTTALGKSPQMVHSCLNCAIGGVETWTCTFLIEFIEFIIHFCLPLLACIEKKKELRIKYLVVMPMSREQIESSSIGPYTNKIS